ncbi:hypothetical protein [Leptolyngbya sp. AN10]|uniref:hypothetical protein n=1 Tax=Leptolyngbya sp. AN10 TaxID=3423365 RepID=UPI003D321406
MPTLNLISGLLGGMGKSLFSRVMIHIHEKEGIPFIAFDADPQTYNVHKYYRYCVEPMEISESKEKGTDNVFKAMETGKTILINLAASSGQAVQDWFQRDDFFTLIEELAEESAKTRYRLINWFLSDASEISIEQFLQTVDQFEANKDQVIHVLVKNLGKSTHEDWARAMSDELLQAALTLPNVHQMVFPRFLKPENFDGMKFTFAQAMTKEGVGSFKLNLLDRRRVTKFLTDTQSNSEALGLLDPPQKTEMKPDSKPKKAEQSNSERETPSA